MIDFPNNPKVGDAFEQGGTSYLCVLANPVVWNASPTAAPISDAPADDKTYGRRNAAWKALDKTDVGLPNVDNTTDLAKPISTATQAALNTKEPNIAASAATNYWRGDKTWQVLNKAAVGLGNVDNTADAAKVVQSALYVRSGANPAGALIPFSWVDDSTQPTYLWGGESVNGQVYHWSRVKSGKTATVEGASGGTISSAVVVNGALSSAGEIRAASHVWAENGVSFGLVVNGNYPYLRFTGDNWRLQMERSTGALMYVHPNNTQLMIVSGGGQITSGATGGGDGFYCAANGYRTDKGANTAFYAPNGGIVVGTTINAGSTIYSDGNVSGASISARSVIYVHPNNGMQYQPSHSDNGAGGSFNCIAYGGPNYGNFNQQYFHQSGSWVGWRITSTDNKELRWEGQGGTATSNGWGTWSDSRLKTALTVIENAREKVAALTGYTYTSINSKHYDGSPIRRAGLIAQDALAVLPESVNLIDEECFAENKAEPDPSDETPGKRYSMEYDAIVALLVNDNNAMAERIDLLESRLAALEA